MLMWTIDKLMRAEHAAAVFAAFYGLGGLGAGNLLFFAAWPMLGAALALFLLRDEDRLWTV
jgi:hypothetical protein